MPETTAKPQLVPVPRVTNRVLQAITDRIVATSHPEKVVLFGSRAYGDPAPESDVDLLVVLDSDLDRVARYRLVSQALHGAGWPSVDIVVRTPAEIAERLAIGDFFIYEILEKGRVLYDAKHDDRPSR